MASICWLLVAGCERNLSPESRPSSQPAVAQFRETAEPLGLKYAWGPRNRSPLTNLDTFGAGCGFLDWNGDGHLDVIAVGEPGVRLFLGGEEGRFSDDSERLGFSQLEGHWIGIASGDADGDGRLDLLLTGYRRLALLRNLEGGRFEDVTERSGLSSTNWNRWGSSAGFADLDGDGDHDIVLANYVQFGPDAKKFCELAAGVVSGCPPQEYDPEYSRVYRNDRGRFTDVTIASGCNTTHGKGLAIAFCDYDSDGKVDFYIGNDGTPSDLLHNLGGFKFRNVGIETGAAFGTMGQPTAAMGADWGDFDRDGLFDIASSAFSDEEYTLLRQVEGLFRPYSAEADLGLVTYKPLGFGTKFLDADNDGRLDLHFMNGHVYDNVSLIDPSSTYAQPMMLFRQKPDGKLEDLAATAGPGFAEPLVGRGSAAGDYDRDGRLDLLAVNLEGRLRLYHNETANKHHWLRLELRGKQSGNRHAFGARVVLEDSLGKQMRDVNPASSYLSLSETVLHFGLGADAAIKRLSVRWPSGKRQEAVDVAADQSLTWIEGEAAPRVIMSR